MNALDIPTRINGKVQTIKCRVPSCWEEMTTGQYIRVIREWEDGTDIADRDYFKLFNILTDGKFTGFESTIENEVTLINLIGWVITQPFQFTQELPKVLVIGNKVIDIPRHPRELSIGQNIHLRRDYIDKSKKIEENIAIATAIYLQPLIDNSLFKINRAIEIAKEVEQMPINLIYPIGFFLLERAMTFGTRQEKTWLLPRVSLKQMLGLMSRIWRR